jgi:hypothetical protein
MRAGPQTNLITEQWLFSHGYVTFYLSLGDGTLAFKYSETNMGFQRTHRKIENQDKKKISSHSLLLFIYQSETVNFACVALGIHCNPPDH